MGCASSKPSKKNVNKNKNNNNQQQKQANEQQQQQQNEQQQQQQQKNTTYEQIKGDRISIGDDQGQLLTQIQSNEKQVIAFIVKRVHKELNTEITKNGQFTAAVQAAAHFKENDAMIEEAAKRAIDLLTKNNNNSQESSLTTYKQLCDTLKQSQQTHKHKNRACELTTLTIHDCLQTVNNNHNSNHNDLLELLDLKNNQKTDVNNNSNNTSNLHPTVEINVTPEHQKVDFNPSELQLMSRAEANEVARIIFYSSKSNESAPRPVVHVSNRVHDAYYVTKQVREDPQSPDSPARQQLIDKDEVQEILSAHNQPSQMSPQFDQYQQEQLEHQEQLHLRIKQQRQEEKEARSVVANAVKAATVKAAAAGGSVATPSNSNSSSSSSARSSSSSSSEQLESASASAVPSSHPHSASDADPDQANALAQVPVQAVVVGQNLTDKLNEAEQEQKEEEETESPKDNNENNETTNNDRTNYNELTTVTPESIRPPTVVIEAAVSEFDNNDNINNNSNDENYHQNEDENENVTGNHDGNIVSSLIQGTSQLVESTVIASVKDDEEEIKNANSENGHDNANENIEENNTNNNQIQSDNVVSPSSEEEGTQDNNKEEGSDPTVDQGKLDDREYNNHAFKGQPGVNDASTQDAATKIQAAVRAHSERDAKPEANTNKSD